MHMCFSKTFILSATGDSRPFSKDADGTVLGEGIGLLVLKRLEDAERDGDRIYAVIRGIGSSSDGKAQSIYAPRPEGQLEALRIAYESSDTDPASVELVEAHGTGTRVGDNVEFSALKRLFAQSSQKGSSQKISFLFRLYSSSTIWKLLPPNPNALTPDLRACSFLENQGIVSVFM